MISIVTTPIQHFNESPSQHSNVRESRDEENLLIFPGDMIIYIENTKESTDKLLELIKDRGQLLHENLICKNKFHL